MYIFQWNYRWQIHALIDDIYNFLVENHDVIWYLSSLQFYNIKYKFWENISEIQFQISMSINQKHMNAVPVSKTKLYLQYMANRWRPRCVCIHKSGDHWAKDTVDYSVFVTRLTTANLHNVDSDSGLIRFYCFLWR